MFRLPSISYKSYYLNPKQTRSLFNHKGWSKVICFPTQDFANRAHEYVQQKFLKEYFADGLYINPVIGSNSSGSVHPNFILDSFIKLV